MFEEYENNGVKILWICTAPEPAPVFANNFLDIGKNDVQLPALPYYDYPFNTAASIPEYVVSKIIRDPNLYVKYDGKVFDDILDELAEAARLLGKKYVIYLDERVPCRPADGGSAADEVIFTNRKELVDKAKCVANALRKAKKVVKKKGGDPWDHVAVSETLWFMMDEGVCSQ